MIFIDEIRTGLVVVTASGVLGGLGLQAQAGSVVRFDTVLGAFDVELFDDETPLHVENFLNYVDRGDYNNSIVHRDAERADGTPFVIQGGLATTILADGESVPNPFTGLTPIPTDPAVTNEPGISNTRGTLALARQGGAVNSGTSQWFINVGDNTDLDAIDEGFTVFGEVLGDGLEIVDAIAALPTVSFGSPLNELPLRNIDDGAELAGILNGDGISNEELVIVNSITRLADAMPSEPDDGDENEGEDGNEGDGTGSPGMEILDPEGPDVMMPGENQDPGNGNGNSNGEDIVPDMEEEPIFAEGDGDGSMEDGNGSGNDNDGGTEVVPTPGAFAAGLLGLGVLVSRRRRTAD
ncbi:MAG: peptidylprolyl isomerase [Planctomycetota bacterium]